VSRIAVTGAGGFVGRNVTAALRSAGNSVTALLGPDDDDPPEAETVLRGDLLVPGLADAVLEGAKHVVHAAGPPSVAASFADPVEFARIHVAGTAAIASAAVRHRAASLVLVSSAEVYGAGSPKLIDETRACAPISPYGAAKLGGEWMARTICDHSEIGLTILRPFSLYGPQMRQASLLGTILDQVRADGNVVLFDLAPVRDYLHIGDFTALLVRTLESPAPYRLLNACSGRGVSVRELARLVLDAASGSGTVSARERRGRPTDVSELVGDHRKAEETLGWRARIPLEQGVAGLLPV
jgi:UDP-glucose 4-epimerase